MRSDIACALLLCACAVPRQLVVDVSPVHPDEPGAWIARLETKDGAWVLDPSDDAEPQIRLTLDLYRGLDEYATLSLWFIRDDGRFDACLSGMTHTTCRPAPTARREEILLHGEGPTHVRYEEATDRVVVARRTRDLTIDFLRYGEDIFYQPAQLVAHPNGRIVYLQQRERLLAWDLEQNAVTGEHSIAGYGRSLVLSRDLLSIYALTNERLAAFPLGEDGSFAECGNCPVLPVDGGAVAMSSADDALLIARKDGVATYVDPAAWGITRELQATASGVSGLVIHESFAYFGSRLFRDENGQAISLAYIDGDGTRRSVATLADRYVKPLLSRAERLYVATESPHGIVALDLHLKDGLPSHEVLFERALDAPIHAITFVAPNLLYAVVGDRIEILSALTLETIDFIDDYRAKALATDGTNVVAAVGDTVLVVP